VGEAVVVLARQREGDVLLVGHGAVGTILLPHYSKVGISRGYDRPPGGGHYFAMKKADRMVIHAWRRMEDAP
jgi:broad specificity phosphatase PhoE